ncbi:MAG: methyltransferase domain-containing protein [Candidatus Bathyarchaeia archaeon]
MNPTYKGSVESLRDFWESRSESFERDYGIRTEGIVRIVNGIAELIKGRLVLDIGCGPGIAGKLFPRNSDTVGLDFSISMLRSAKNRIRQLVLGDSLNLPFGSETFQIATCFFVASDYSQKERIFSEAFRVLQDKGLLLFADYSPRDEHWKLRRRIRPVMGESFSIYIEDGKTLSNKLEQTGFKVREAKLIRFDAAFELKRYVRTETELQLLKETDPDLFTHVQGLTERKRIRREFILLVARK